MKTCNKIETKVGPLFKDGGFYYQDMNGHTVLLQLKQVK